MKQLIKQIQQQPHGVKSKFAFIGASVCTGLIALIWVTTLPARLSEIGKGAGAVQNSALTEKALSAYDIYKQTVEKAQQAASTSAQASVSKSEMEDKVNSLIESVHQNDLRNAAVQVAAPATPPPPPSAPMPIMIEVVPSTPATTTADDSNIGKPVLIETR
jgi:hypothetical protein